jgi:hypothetical protein
MEYLKRCKILKEIGLSWIILRPGNPKSLNEMSQVLMYCVADMSAPHTVLVYPRPCMFEGTRILEDGSTIKVLEGDIS